MLRIEHAQSVLCVCGSTFPHTPMLCREGAQPPGGDNQSGLGRRGKARTTSERASHRPPYIRTPRGLMLIGNA